MENNRKLQVRFSMCRRGRLLRAAAIMLVAACFSQGQLPPAEAATATGNLNVQITIQAECTLGTINTVNFATHGVLNTNVDSTGSLSVTCTNTTAYNIGLDAGAGSGATIAARLMTGTGAATVTYSLYIDSGRTQVWGSTIGTDTVAATGTGAAQSYTVYGRVPPQTTPAPGIYTDTVVVTVTY